MPRSVDLSLEHLLRELVRLLLRGWPRLVLIGSCSRPDHRRASSLREVEWEIDCAGSHASSRVLRPSASPLVAPDPVTTPGEGSQVGTGSANTTPTMTAAVLE